MSGKGYCGESHLVFQDDLGSLYIFDISSTCRSLVYQHIAGGFTLIVEDYMSMGAFSHYFRDIAHLDDYLEKFTGGDVLIFQTDTNNPGDFIYAYRQSFITALAKALSSFTMRPKTENEP